MPTKKSLDLCGLCGSKSKNLARHVCHRPFTSDDAKAAWLGDVEHRRDVVLYLLERGLGPECSHTILAGLVSADSQSSVLSNSDFALEGVSRLSSHRQAQFFEALYFEEPAFVRHYVECWLPALALSLGVDSS